MEREQVGHRVPGIVCIGCGETIDGASPASSNAMDHGSAPEQGNASLCFYCGTLAIFERHAVGYMYLREPTDSERVELLADPEIVHAMTAIRSFHEGEPAALNMPDAPDPTPENIARMVASSDVVVCLGKSLDLIQGEGGAIGSAVSCSIFNPGRVPRGAIAAALRIIADSYED